MGIKCGDIGARDGAGNGQVRGMVGAEGGGEEASKLGEVARACFDCGPAGERAAGEHGTGRDAPKGRCCAAAKREGAGADRRAIERLGVVGCVCMRELEWRHIVAGLGMLLAREAVAHPSD